MDIDFLWKKQLVFYNELIGKYKWNQKPMLDLVEKFIDNRISKKYYPSNSHELLGLSNTEKYENRRVNPMVYIGYSNYSNSFEIYYQNGQGNTVKEEKSIAEINDDILERIENWLT